MQWGYSGRRCGARTPRSSSSTARYARYPGDDYVIPLGKGATLRAGTDLTLVTWGAMVHRSLDAASAFEGTVEVIDLRCVAPWDRERVLDSVKRTGRCLIVHEDTMTAGFGAEIAATVAAETFWFLDAPVERIAIPDIPTPYHPVLLNAVVPDVEQITSRIQEMLSL
jgi:2-oxoisovalerate dehydrogenase E1 component